MTRIDRTLASALQRLVWLANCNAPRDVQRFRKKNPKYIPGDLAGVVAPGLLRQIWKGGREASAKATLILCGHGTLRSIVDSIKRAIEAGAESPLSDDASFLLLPNRVDWPSGEMVYKWPSDLQKDLYLLLRHSRFAKICARAECAAPYFVARRLTQNYCSTDCADAMQNAYRLRWWRENGDKWRHNRKRKSKKQRSKNRGA